MSGDIPSGSLCTSNDVSQLIEELQYTLGEGPCVDAYQKDMVVTEPDLADPETIRWIAFTPPALRAGVRAVFGFPLRVGTVRLGALNLYRDRPGPLGAEQHADALVLADVTARWVLETQAGAPDGVVAKALENAGQLSLRRAQRSGHSLGSGRHQCHRSTHPPAGVRLQQRPAARGRGPGRHRPQTPARMNRAAQPRAGASLRKEGSG